MFKIYWQGFASCALMIGSLGLIFVSSYTGPTLALAVLLIGLFVFGANCMLMGSTLRSMKRK